MKLSYLSNILVLSIKYIYKIKTFIYYRTWEILYMKLSALNMSKIICVQSMIWLTSYKIYIWPVDWRQISLSVTYICYNSSRN